MGVKTGTYKLDKRLTAIAEYRRLIDTLEWKGEYAKSSGIKVGDMFECCGEIYIVASNNLGDGKFVGAIRVDHNGTGQTSFSDYLVYTVEEVLSNESLGSVVPYYEQLVESLPLIEKTEERIEELQNEIDSLEHEIDMQMNTNSEALFKWKRCF